MSPTPLTLSAGLQAAPGQRERMPMEQHLEAISEQIHIAWMEEKQRQGFAAHPWDDRYPGACLCDLPKERHHPDMLPYADLPEHVQEYDRVTARAAIKGVEAAGFQIVPNAADSESPVRLASDGRLWKETQYRDHRDSVYPTG